MRTKTRNLPVRLSPATTDAPRATRCVIEGPGLRARDRREGLDAELTRRQDAATLAAMGIRS